MAADPLYEPLGVRPPDAPASAARRFAWALPVVAILAVAGGAVLLHRERTRTDVAVAVAPIEVSAKALVAPAEPAPPAPPLVTGSIPPAAPSTTTVEVQNGVKVIRFNPAASSDSITVPVTEPAKTALKPAPDPRVAEASHWGTLPRIGAGGVRPADVYARPATATSGPIVALMMAGMGADQMATADAARRLPAAVSFAFPPDIADPAAQVAETRRAGHEAFLQLRAEAAASPVGGALDTLHAGMGRFSGYAGVVLDQASAAALSDIASRGLLVVGPSPGDTAGLVPDVSIDAAKGPAAVRTALDTLIALARSKGSALAVLGGAPLGAEDAAALSAKLAAAGVTLAPVTAVAARRSRAASAK